ncbi:hypothetical protein LPC08_08330 [Roseomonas sp. OT10]|uniref:hypothetical protein n=1 Tax=Roseomonas cutis TaxID=2897332 RepID=UPI001E302ED5|nr:hypothetical protein [Roseomonas sp. OT10]UFN50607.1 hypothetical protein LPC08_08330 [Roseomonas sp. OT10]
MLPRRLIPALLLGLLGPGTAWAQDPSFTLVNRTGQPIHEVYASPSSERSWGHDRLGSEVIPPGRSHLVRIPFQGECVHDIRIVTASGAAEERRGLDTCRLRSIAFGAGSEPATGPGVGAPGVGARVTAPSAMGREGNPSFNLLNRSRRDIREIYATPASRADWGPDLLGATILPPGRSHAVRLPLGECRYDVRVVYDGGASEQRRDVDTCGLSQLVFP